ncbi:MAG: YitT family protein [Defluviitaleaceae bacterium]|nr:YitT family protein [Defluviitaleaceae bacterium]
MNTSKVKSFLGINLGCLMFAIGVVIFRNPNNFATGGMAGISLLFSSFFANIPVGAIMMILNVLVLGLGYLFLGKESGSRSVYGTFALSGLIWIVEILIPLDAPLTNQPFLELIYAVLIPGFGMALVFHFGATTGGTDIVAQIISKYTRLKISTSLLLVDFLIALGAGLLFSMEAMLYSVLGVFLRTFAMDAVMEALRIRKIVVVITEKEEISEKIQGFIKENLHRGATVHKAVGVYTHHDKNVITTVLTRRQAYELQQFIKEHDTGAFITVSNSTEIIGQGFGKFD